MDIERVNLPGIWMRHTMTTARGRRVGVITVSGGAGAVLADAAATEGMELPPLPDEAQAAIRALVPFAGPRNPVDSTAQIANDRTLLNRMLRIMLEGKDDVEIRTWADEIAGVVRAHLA